MPRRFANACEQAGWTAFEFSEGIDTNPFMLPENRALWERGWKAADRAGAVTFEYLARKERRKAGAPASPTHPHKRRRAEHPSGW